MPPFPEPRRPRAQVLFVFALGALVLASPLRATWARSALPWWAPFVVWGAVILAGGFVSERWGRDGPR